jgi:Family of unknown function (DUF6275)
MEDIVQERYRLHDKAARLVFNYIKNNLEKIIQHPTFSMDEVFIVWFCKTLQNWKAIVSTTLPDGMLYEVTYDGDKKQAYIDAYRKMDNVVVRDGDELFRSFPRYYIADGKYFPVESSEDIRQLVQQDVAVEPTDPDQFA